MEEKQKETTQSVKEEIKLLTFQPQQMLDEIAKLKDEVSALILAKNTCEMVIIDMRMEVVRLNRLVPKSLKKRFQEIMLYIFGGQWIEDKDA